MEKEMNEEKKDFTLENVLSTLDGDTFLQVVTKIEKDVTLPDVVRKNAYNLFRGRENYIRAGEIVEAILPSLAMETYKAGILRYSKDIESLKDNIHLTGERIKGFQEREEKFNSDQEKYLTEIANLNEIVQEYKFGVMKPVKRSTYRSIY